MAKYSELANQLWPHLLKKVERVVTGGAGGAAGSIGVGGAPSPHAMDGAHHTGTITAAQGPLFLLADGTRQLTGNLAVSASMTIDGVDLSVHAADPNAHHDTATAGNTAISLSGQAISVALAASSGLEVASGLKIDLDTTPGLVLGAGGVKVLLHPTASGLVLTSGLAVSPGDGLEIASNLVAVDLATNSGLTFSSGDLALGTPTATSVSSSNSVTTSTHTHDVTTSSDVSAGTESILASTSAGGLGLASMFTTGAVDVGQGLTAGNSGFRVIYHTHDYNHTHVVVNPTGGWTLDEQFGLDVDDNLLVRGWIVGKHAIQIAGAKMLVHFDGPAPYETNFKGTAIGHMGQPATMTGGVLFRPGKFGKAIQITHSTTNYIKNPSFEVSASDSWQLASDNGTATWSRDSTKSVYGSYSLKLNRGTATSYAFIATDNQGTTRAVANGATVVVSGYVWVDSGGCILSIYNSSSSLALTSTGSSTTGEWQLIYSSWTNSTGSSVNVHVRLQFTNAVGDMWLDAVQLEEQAFLTPYADGSLASGATVAGTSLLSGHTWNGTAHNSTTSRTAGSLSYARESNLEVPNGTLMMWVYPYAITGSATQNAFFTLDGTSRIAIYIKASTGNWVFRIGAGTELDTGVTADVLTWTHIALTWDSATSDAKIWINGGPGGLGSPYSHHLIYSGFTSIGSTLYVGSDSAGAGIFDGLIDEIAMVDRAMTGPEIVAIYESNAPVFAEAATFHWRAGRNRIYADAEGLWGYGASGSSILGLYAGDETNPAATKSWGGLSLSEGDFLLGRHGTSLGGWMYFDQDLVGGLPAWRFGYADKDILRLDSGGASLYGVLDIDTNGGIYQGTGTFASPTTGLKMWNDGGVGRIAGYGSGTLQWGADTAGKLTAGGGDVVLDSNGVAITGGATNSAVNGMSAANALLWKIGGVTFAGISAENDSGFLTSRLVLTATQSSIVGDSEIYMQSLNTSNPSFSSTFQMTNDGRVLLVAPDYLALNGVVGIGGIPTSTVMLDVIPDVAVTARFRAGTGGVAYNQFTPADASSEWGNVSFLSGYALIGHNTGYLNLTAGGSERVRIESGGNVGINATPTGKLHIDQSSTTAAIPVLVLDQGDVSEEFIEFVGTVSSGNSINTTALGAYYGRVRVSVNGTFKWLALYD